MVCNLHGFSCTPWILLCTMQNFGTSLAADRVHSLVPNSIVNLVYPDITGGEGFTTSVVHGSWPLSCVWSWHDDVAGGHYNSWERRTSTNQIVDGFAGGGHICFASWIPFPIPKTWLTHLHWQHAMNVIKPTRKSMNICIYTSFGLIYLFVYFLYLYYYLFHQMPPNVWKLIKQLTEIKFRNVPFDHGLTWEKRRKGITNARQNIFFCVISYFDPWGSDLATIWRVVRGNSRETTDPDAPM